MARPANPPSAPLASGWGLLQRAWEHQEDLTPWMDAIDWNSPVFVWGEKTPEEQLGSLHHPLVYALALPDRGLGQAIVEAKAMHPWPSSVATQVQSKTRVPLPKMSDFWEWEVLQAVVASKNLKALPLLADGLARGIHENRHSALALNAAGRVLASSGWDLPSLHKAIEILQSAVDAQGQVGDLAWNVLLEACKKGQGDVAVGMLERFPGARVLPSSVQELASFGQFSQALVLLEKCKDIGGSFTDRYASSLSDNNVSISILGHAMQVLDQHRQHANPSASLVKKAEAAEALALALCQRVTFPVSTESKRETSAIYAKALAYLPQAFPRLRSKPYVSSTVLGQWWVNGPVDGELFRACFTTFQEGSAPEVVRAFLSGNLENKIEAVGLNKQLPLAKKIERLPAFLDELREMEAPLGLDAMSLAKHFMPDSFLKGKLGAHWQEVVATYQAKTLAGALPESPFVGKRSRL